MYKDPICGMNVDSNSEYKYENNGEIIYFCSSSCMATYKKNLNKESTKEEKQSNSNTYHCHTCGGVEQDNKKKDKQSGSGTYYCPMCEGVEQEGPGICPKCGMMLEPKGFSLKDFKSDGSSIETKKMKKNLIGTLIFSIIILIAIIAHHINMINIVQSSYISLACATIIFFYTANYILIRGIQSIVRLSLNMFTLIFLGVATSYFYSLYNIFINSLGNIYFDSVGIISLIVTIGQLIEARANRKSGASLRDLAELLQDRVSLISGSDEVEVDLKDIVAGDTVIVKAGEKISVDGKIIEGKSDVNESLLTGESIPVSKNINDTVYAGTMCLEGMIKIKVSKDGNSSYIYSLLEDINDVSKSRVEVSSLVDVVSSYFTIAVIAIAIITFIVWTFVLGDMPDAMEFAISVLLVACPCAIGIATPISIFVGIGSSAKRGVFFKNIKSLELLKKIDTFVFDKTGTLTTGRILVDDFKNYTTELTDSEVLSYAHSLESFSNHPYAKGISIYANEHDAIKMDVKDFKYDISVGVSGTIDGKSVKVTNHKYKSSLTKDRSKLYVIVDDRVIGDFSFTDTLKGTSYKMVDFLVNSGKKIFMLTGDSYENAKKFSDRLNVELAADKNSDEKNGFIKALQQNGKKVAMVGDGINDALVLNSADVSISMGDGVSLANSSSDIVLLKGDLQLVKTALDDSFRIFSNIKQNLFFAFIYNIIVITIATGIFYKVGLHFNPIFASIAMSLSSLTVISNALRLSK